MKSAYRCVGLLLTILTMALCLTACRDDVLSIRGIAPGSGVIGGNEPVKIEGTGFKQGMGIDVYFGGTKSPAVVVEGTDRLVVTTPSMEKAGIVDVRIQTDQGKVITLRNAFRYVENQNWNLTDGFGGTGSKTKR